METSIINIFLLSVNYLQICLYEIICLICIVRSFAVSFSFKENQIPHPCSIVYVLLISVALEKNQILIRNICFCKKDFCPASYKFLKEARVMVPTAMIDEHLPKFAQNSILSPPGKNRYLCNILEKMSRK